MAKNPVAILYDSDGNPVSIIDDSGVHRLAQVAKIQNSSGTTVNPATQDTLAAIKDTDGIKKIVDALPSGTNTLGKIDQGAAGSTAWKTDGSGVTQPVSAASLPLPAGAATETTLASIKNTDGVKKITDPLPAGTNEIGKVAQGTKAANNAAWPQFLVDSSGNVVGVLNDSGTYRLQVSAKIAAGGASQNVVLVDGEGEEVTVEDAVNWSAAQSGLVILGKDSITSPSKVRDLAVDELGRLITAPSGTLSNLAGLAFGQVTLSATTVVPLRSTTYTEQTSGAQRSLVSASANDTAAGTGARTVKITYYTSAMVGPQTETVTLNGVTPVNTVNTDICFIEKMEVTTAGGTTFPAGIVSLKAATGGGGVTIWSIAVGEGRTMGAHHYVQSAKTCYVTGMSGGIKGSDTTGFALRAQDLTTPASPGVDNQINEILRAPSSGNTPIRTYGTPIRVAGPSRVTMMVFPDSTSSRIYYGAFDYYEQ